MKCILLAAGKGTRISKSIENVPKCTLKVGNEPLIVRTVNMLNSLNINAVLCVGYRKNVITDLFDLNKIKVYYNPFYEVTNSIASLWFALKELDDDVIIMNGDVFIEKDALLELIDDKNEVVMTIDKSRINEGDYFFGLDDNDCIVRYGKDLTVPERSGEYIGLAKISKSFLPIFNNKLANMIEEQKYNCWWEDVLYQLTGTSNNIHTINLSNYFWREIDYIDDYEKILEYVENK
ncbi:MAG: phosphocholine cytidylyltransferase family protein [Bacilli bacterium]|jgi:choline kinase|nr:phosphocholine cytidylyltransferase family protein [Bacilli bacterium]